MSSEIKAAAGDELRIRNYRAQLQSKNETELRETRREHDEELVRLMEGQTDRTEALRQAYDVQISHEAEHLEDKLHDVRSGAQTQISREKKIAEEELSKIKSSHQQRVAEYRKNSEAQLDALRKEHQAATEKMADRVRKAEMNAARKEKEVSS